MRDPAKNVYKGQTPQERRRKRRYAQLRRVVEGLCRAGIKIERSTMGVTVDASRYRQIGVDTQRVGFIVTVEDSGGTTPYRVHLWTTERGRKVDRIGYCATSSNVVQNIVKNLPVLYMPRRPGPGVP